MAKKVEKEPKVINIMADGSIVEDLTDYVIPYTTKTADFYKLMYSFMTGTKYTDIIAPKPEE